MSVDKTVNNLILRAGGSVYFLPTGGTITTNGCKKITADGDDLVIYTLSSGVWTEIWRYSA